MNYTRGVINALFMVLSSMAAAVLLGVFNLPLSRFFGILAVGSMVVSIYISCRSPLYALRLMVWALTRMVYRVRCQGLDRLPGKGPAVLV